VPIYEYKCDGCDKVLEIIQKFSDEPLETCPDCGGPLGKLISNTTFVLKGSGWYSDGYASSPDRKPAAAVKTGEGKKSDTLSKGTEKKEASAA
jgi:putative FmdB family regulatory protein